MGEHEFAEEIGRMLDEYLPDQRGTWYAHPESEESEVPVAMRTGEVFEYLTGELSAVFADPAEVLPAVRSGEFGEFAWVGWRMLPSDVTSETVSAVEEEFGVRFPPLYLAYLRARLQLIEIFGSDKHDELIRLPVLPADQPLEPLRKLLVNWGGGFLLAGFIPCGTYTDEGQYGLFFDAGRRDSDGDCPVVAIDHEIAVGLDERDDPRETALPDVIELYASCREMFDDILTPRGTCEN